MGVFTIQKHKVVVWTYMSVFVYICKDYLNFSLNHKVGLCNGMFTTKILCIFHVYAQSRINTISIYKKDIKCY